MKLSSAELHIIQNFFGDKPVLRAFLFGSFARGDASESSDIDILVDLDYSQQIGLQFVAMKLDLEEYLQKSVDLVSANGVSKHILPFINKDKHLIYEK